MDNTEFLCLVLYTFLAVSTFSHPKSLFQKTLFECNSTLDNYLSTTYNVNKMGDMSKEILTLEEAAELLEISPRALREAASRGEVPAQKIARRWRFSRFALHQWLSNGSRENNPYLRHAGILASNPLWAEVKAMIEEEREAQRQGRTKE
ncbi:MAG: helix-turn-helix domain-containing protein [Candidatus Bipolaricaulia bacterium]